MNNVKKEILRSIAEELYDIYGDTISKYSIYDIQKESRFNFDIIKTSTRYHIICNDKKYENNNVFELCKLDINGNNIELHEFDIGTNMETVKDNNNKVISVNKKGFKANKLIKNNYEKKNN
jgi:stage III sporulation protein SpoIIIAA